MKYYLEALGGVHKIFQIIHNTRRSKIFAKMVAAKTIIDT